MRKLTGVEKFSAAELERFAFLGEECSEVQKCVGKASRFGRGSEFLNKEGEGFSVEVADILYAIKMMALNGDLDLEKVKEYYNKKCETAFWGEDHAAYPTSWEKDYE